MKPLRPLEIDLAGTALIEASAGTGKTHTIATLYLRLLLEARCQVDEILVVTYTRAATAELRDRIRRRVAEAALAFESGDPGDDEILRALLARFDTEAARQSATRHLEKALANFDEAAILTVHGFCQRALRENAFESRSSFDVELLADQNALLREIVNDHWSKTIAIRSETLVRFLLKEHPKIDSLMGVARHGAVAAPPHVIPSRSRMSVEELEELGVQWCSAVEKACEIWQRDAPAVLELLLNASRDGILHGKSYGKSNIGKSWERHTNELLVDRRLPVSGKDPLLRLERLTSRKLASSTKGEHQPPSHEFFDACEELFDLNEKLHPALLDYQAAFERQLIETVETELRVRKAVLAQQSYDDLLDQMSRALEGRAGDALVARLRREYRAALVDEFQDTDQLQYRILRRIWHEGGSTLFLIGDPKQAIYAFRGADVYAYLEAKGDAGERCFTLNVNWRSDPGMIAGVEALFGQIDDPFRIDGIDFESVSARSEARDELLIDGEASCGLDLLFYPRAGAQAITQKVVKVDLPWRIASDIVSLLRADSRIGSEPVRPGDIAGLCRTNEQTRAMCDALREFGVPVALLGTASVFDSEEARELELVLEAIAVPRSTSRVRTALTTHLFGITADQLDSRAENEAVWNEWLRRFSDWHDLWSRSGFVRMFQQLLRDAKIHCRLLGIDAGERRLINFLHLVELAERAALHEHLGPGGLVNWLGRMRRDHELRGNAIGEEGELRLETDENAVKVVTVHKSKGLEYPIVYCPYLFESAELRKSALARIRFHAPEQGGEIALDLGSVDKDRHLQIAKEENLAEDMRMLYVALTRAKHRCSVVWGGVRRAETSGLFRLLHPLPETTPDAFKGMDDAALRNELDRFMAAAQGGVVVRDLPSEREAILPPVIDHAEFFPARATREISTHWRHSSFSALAASEREAGRALSTSREEGLDHDAVEERPALAGPESPEHEIRFAALPPGATTGTLLHSILEHLDFSRPAFEQFDGEIASALDSHGVASDLRQDIARDLDRVCAVRWSEHGPELSQLPRHKRLDELEFLLPVAGGEGARERGERMDAGQLAEIFRRHGEDAFLRGYADRVDTLQFEALAGYLRGFVDLVFEWKDRFYVVDYKSNHLGPNAVDYLPARLESPMAEHHYVLQYHIYTVALDRYLEQRLAGYDYDSHFGGVYYLFLRGMDPAHSPGCGVYHHRPSRASIRALSSLFDDPRTLTA